MRKLSVSRRNLPHWFCDAAVYWITFRLADALPQSKLKRWREERALWLAENPEPYAEVQLQEYQRKFTERLHYWLDAGYGSSSLTDPVVRSILVETLMRFDGKRHRLHAAVIMPNHVHALLEPLQGGDNHKRGAEAGGVLTGSSVSHSPLAILLKGIKGTSARGINQYLGRSGRLWMEESYDRIVRDAAEYQHFLHYIEMNPERAGLAAGTYWLYRADFLDPP